MFQAKGNWQRELFIWKKEHDICLIRELLIVEPYMHKPLLKERGNTWRQIGENVNNIDNPKFSDDRGC